MKNIMKKLCLFASVLGAAFLMAACSSSNENATKDVRYVETHQYDDITSVSAKMHQKHGHKDKMGSIKFTETDSGLKMIVDLKDVRPGVEYNLYVYEMKGCAANKKEMKKQKNMKAGCEKKKVDINLPAIKGDSAGMIESTFMITGVSAADMNNKKITINRDNENGDMVDVGWGRLEQSMLF